MKINRLIIGVLAVLAFSACKKDFLETAPTSDIPTNQVFTSINNVKMAVNGIAYVMCNQHSTYGQGYCGENRIMSHYMEWPSQEFRQNQYASGWTRVMTGQYNTNKTSTYATYAWGYYYEIIGNANSIVENIDKSDGSEAEKTFYKAQARTFRDYAFVKLLEIYSYRWQDTNNGSTDGIVMRMDESTGDMPLSSVADCYKLIYEDLDKAIAEYQASGMDRKAGEVWLPNINVAYAVYARAALHKQDYGTALKMAQNARKGYALMSNTDYKAGFCRPTSEWLFGSYDDETENKWYWTFGKMAGCNGSDAKTKKYGAGDMEKEFTNRVLAADPTLLKDLRISLFLTEDKIGLGDLVAGNHINTTYGQMSSKAAKAAAKAYIQSMTPPGLDEAYQFGNYYINAQLKFWVFGFPGVSYVPFIRASEMLLIEAEANYFLGNTTEAKNNLIELNVSTGRNPNYVPGVVSADLFQEIRDYRELELWGEGFNWYDLKRWNIGLDRKTFAEGGNCHDATAGKVGPEMYNKWTFVVPENELQFNGAID